MWAVFHSVFHLVFSKVTLFALILFAIRLPLLIAIEKQSPAHEISYRDVLPRDITAMFACGLIVIPIADFLDGHLLHMPMLPQSILEWPLAIRFTCYLILADLGHYWIHRLLHTAYMWRAHKWHHAPTYMYWLAGTRESVVQTTLVNIPYIVAGVFLDIAPWWMFWAIILKNIVQNDFMHLNVWWGNRWLEWFIVTPRYHHIHHSDDPAHYTNNLAALFPVWDHLFGTYIDPEKAPRNLTFGIGETVSPSRLLIGL